MHFAAFVAVMQLCTTCNCWPSCPTSSVQRFHLTADYYTLGYVLSIGVVVEKPGIIARGSCDQVRATSSALASQSQFVDDVIYESGDSWPPASVAASASHKQKSVHHRFMPFTPITEGFLLILSSAAACVLSVVYTRAPICVQLWGGRTDNLDCGLEGAAKVLEVGRCGRGLTNCNWKTLIY